MSGSRGSRKRKCVFAALGVVEWDLYAVGGLDATRVPLQPI